MGANASSQMIPINKSSTKNGMMLKDIHNRKRMTRRPAIASSSSSSSLPSLMEESSTSSCSSLAHDDEENDRATAIESIQERLQHLHDVEGTKYNKAVKAPFPVWKKNTQWRRQMIDWMISLLEYCDLPYPVAAAATYYLDVAVSHSQIVSSSDYQCTATAALFLALKTYDAPNLRCMGVDSLVHLGDGRFDTKDVLQRERDLLECLEWNLFPPTPFCYLHEYMALLFVLRQEEDDSLLFLDWLQEEAQGRIVSSLSQSSLMHAPSHAIAQAALLSTLEDACCHILSSSSKQESNNNNFAESIRQVLLQLEEYAQFQMDDPQLVQVLTSLVDPKTTTKPFGGQENALLLLDEDDNDDNEGSHWRKTSKSGTASCFSNPVSPTHVVVE